MPRGSALAGALARRLWPCGCCRCRCTGLAVAAVHISARFFIAPKLQQPARLCFFEQVAKGADGAGARTVRIRATSQGVINNLKYDAWVAGNRAFVEKESKGEVAYVHIRSMNQPSLAIFRNEIDQFWNRKGIVIDMSQLAAAISASVHKAERSSGYDISRAFVSVAGSHTASINSRGAAGLVANRGVRVEDMDKAIENARSIAIPHNREVLHVIPRTYSLDGQEHVRSPLGMHGFRLDVEVHIITVSSTSVASAPSPCGRGIA